MCLPHSITYYFAYQDCEKYIKHSKHSPACTTQLTDVVQECKMLKKWHAVTLCFNGQLVRSSGDRARFALDAVCVSRHIEDGSLTSVLVLQYMFIHSPYLELHYRHISSNILKPLKILSLAYIHVCTYVHTYITHTYIRMYVHMYVSTYTPFHVPSLGPRTGPLRTVSSPCSTDCYRGHMVLQQQSKVVLTAFVV